MNFQISDYEKKTKFFPPSKSIDRILEASPLYIQNEREMKELFPSLESRVPFPLPRGVKEESLDFFFSVYDLLMNDSFFDHLCQAIIVAHSMGNEIFLRKTVYLLWKLGQTHFEKFFPSSTFDSDLMTELYSYLPSDLVPDYIQRRGDFALRWLTHHWGLNFHSIFSSSGSSESNFNRRNNPNFSTLLSSNPGSLIELPTFVTEHPDFRKASQETLSYPFNRKEVMKHMEQERINISSILFDLEEKLPSHNQDLELKQQEVKLLIKTCQKTLEKMVPSSLICYCKNVLDIDFFDQIRKSFLLGPSRGLPKRWEGYYQVQMGDPEKEPESWSSLDLEVEKGLEKLKVHVRDGKFLLESYSENNIECLVYFKYFEQEKKSILVNYKYLPKHEYDRSNRHINLFCQKGGSLLKCSLKYSAFQETFSEEDLFKEWFPPSKLNSLPISSSVRNALAYDREKIISLYTYAPNENDIISSGVKRWSPYPEFILVNNEEKHYLFRDVVGHSKVMIIDSNEFYLEGHMKKKISDQRSRSIYPDFCHSIRLLEGYHAINFQTDRVSSIFSLNGLWEKTYHMKDYDLKIYVSQGLTIKRIWKYGKEEYLEPKKKGDHSTLSFKDEKYAYYLEWSSSSSSSFFTLEEVTYKQVYPSFHIRYQWFPDGQLERITSVEDERLLYEEVYNEKGELVSLEDPAPLTILRNGKKVFRCPLVPWIESHTDENGRVIEI